jgi:hypothetical protein
MNWKSPYFAGAVLITTLVIFATVGCVINLRETITLRDGRIAALELAELDYRAALEAKPKEILKLVDRVVTKEVIKLVTEKKAEPIMGIAGTATSAPIQVPCPAPTEGGGEAPAALSSPVQFELDAQLIVLGLKAGKPLWKGDINGRAFTINPNWSTNIIFPPEQTKIQVMFSTNVREALESYNRSWIKRHTGMQCPGIGVGYDIYNQRASTVVSCTYGFTWF